MVLKLLATALGLYVAVGVLGGLDYEGPWTTFALLALILAVINAAVRPIATILSLPVVIVTLGLFLLVINAAMLAIVVAISEANDLGLTSTGFGTTLVGAFIVSLVTWGAEAILGGDD